MKRHDAAGFTLLELMISLLILSVLLAIAIPSYDAFVQRSRRAEGRELLGSIAQSQGRYYANHARYATTMAELGITQATSENGFYIATLGTSARGFQVSAAPQGVHSSDPCGTLTFDDLGQRGVGADATLDAKTCWR